MVPEPADEGTLRAKYWDWCSARLADRFLALSADEIYHLAQRDPGSGETPPERPPAGTDPAALMGTSASSFRRLVARATERLTREMGLPSFEQWAAAYRDDPGRFDAELSGMWRDAEAGRAEEPPP